MLISRCVTGLWLDTGFLQHKSEKQQDVLSLGILPNPMSSSESAVCVESFSKIYALDGAEPRRKTGTHTSHRFNRKLNRADANQSSFRKIPRADAMSALFD